MGRFKISVFNFNTIYVHGFPTVLHATLHTACAPLTGICLYCILSLPGAIQLNSHKSSESIHVHTSKELWVSMERKTQGNEWWRRDRQDVVLFSIFYRFLNHFKTHLFVLSPFHSTFFLFTLSSDLQDQVYLISINELKWPSVWNNGDAFIMRNEVVKMKNSLSRGCYIITSFYCAHMTHM